MIRPRIALWSCSLFALLACAPPQSPAISAEADVHPVQTKTERSRWPESYPFTPADTYLLRSDMQRCAPGGKVRVEYSNFGGRPVPSAMDVQVDGHFAPGWTWFEFDRRAFVDADFSALAEGPHELRLVERGGKQQAFAFTLRVDRTPPRVLAVEGADDPSARRGHSALLLSEPAWGPDESSVTAADASGKPVPLLTRFEQYRSDQYTYEYRALVAPLEPVSPGSTLHATVSDLRDCAGHPLEFDWSFKVAGCADAPGDWEAADCELVRTTAEQSSRGLLSRVFARPGGKLLHVSTMDFSGNPAQVFRDADWSVLAERPYATASDSVIVGGDDRVYVSNYFRVLRLDGAVFTPLQSPTGTGTIHPSVKQLVWDKRLGLLGYGTVWSEDAIVRWTGQRWELLAKPPAKSIRTLATDGAGRIWVAAQDPSAYVTTFWYLDGRDWRALPPLTAHVHAPMAFDRHGRLHTIKWDQPISTARRPLVRWTGEDWEPWTVEPELQASELLSDGEGGVLVVAFDRSDSQRRFLTERADGAWADVAPALPANGWVEDFTVAGDWIYGISEGSELIRARLTR